jgi:acetyl-CoA acetyltransferase
MSEQVAIAATFELPPGRYPDLSVLDMYHLVMRGALGKWRLRPAQIDGLFTAPAGISSGRVEIATHEKLAQALGIRPTVSETLYAGGAMFAIMVQRAAALIRTGMADCILCVGAGQFMKVSAGGAQVQARLASDPSFEFPYGTYIPANYALVASQYMHSRQVKREALARVAVSARLWALRNPRAIMGKKGHITVEDVLASRPICSPFNLLDCSVPCDGGGAVLVASGSTARRLTSQPAYLLGHGEFHSHNTISEAQSLADTGAQVTGRAAFAAAGLSPSDINVLQLYDAFSVCPLMLLDDLGFCAPGGSADLVMSGALDPGGHLPTNTNGGLLSFGHTGDASGMSVLIEGARQLMGEAEETRAADSQLGLVHCYGGMFSEHATLILGKNP